MSLYSDLNEVLTPYANKINELAASDDQIKAELENLETTEIYVQDTSLIINTNLVNGNEVSY